jgi:hypothetical protein
VRGWLLSVVAEVVQPYKEVPVIELR